MSAFKDMSIDDEVLDGVRRVVQGGDYTIEMDRTWQNDPVLRLTSGPRGRGARRDKWIIVARTYADAYRCLAECLERIGGVTA